jgi:pilus assembly protein Flp/PilA
MRKFLNDVKALAKDQDGVVSFEYIIVAACVVAAVAAVFSTNTGAGIGLALSNGLNAIVSKIPTT